MQITKTLLRLLRTIPGKALVIIATLLASSGILSAQSGIYESFVALSKNGAPAEWFDLKGNTPNYDFQGNLGSVLAGSGTLFLYGGENKVFKCGTDDITDGKLYYRVYKSGAAVLPAFAHINMSDPVVDIGTASCGGINQRWRSTNANINLINGLQPGNYVLEIYTTAAFTWSSGSGTHTENNGGANYKASFTLSTNNCVNGISVSPSATQTICQNGAPTPLVAAITTSTGSGPANISYAWYSHTNNSNSGGTLVAGPVNTTTATSTSSFTPPTNTPGTLYYYCVVTNTDGSCDGSKYATAPVQVTVNAPLVPDVAVNISPGNQICAGATATFTATPFNGGGSPSYQWKLNGVNVGTNSPIYSSSTLNNGDSITVVMTSGLSCVSPNPVTSNPAVITVNPTIVPFAEVVPASTSICAGSTATFTALVNNGGPTPSYQWRVNGALKGTNSATFSSNTINDGDKVTVTVTSSALCPSPNPVSSAPVAMTVNPNIPVSVNISATATTICAGTSVTFTATPTNGGSSPTYQWRVNGVNIGSPTTNNTFTSSTLSHNDVVRVIMTSNITPCATGNPATSNALAMTVNPPLPVSVSIAASATTICQGTSVTFTATPTNPGAAPLYQWRINSINVGAPTSTTTFTTTTLNNGDVVSVVLTSNATPCATGNPATSNSISMTVNLPSSLTLTSVAATTAQTVCVNNAITNITYALGGGATGVSLTSGSFPPGVSGNLSGGVYTITGTPSTPGTYNYTITTTGPCTNVSASGTITVTANSTLTLTSAAATTNQTRCINAAITNITYSLGGSATGATVTGLPTGVNATVSSGLVTISGTPTVSGTFNFTVTTTGPCINNSQNGTITINATVVPAVTIAATATSICTGTTVTFTATPTNGGPSPVYTWYINNTPQSTGVSGNTMTKSNLTNGMIIKAELTSSEPCPIPAKVTSNLITMTVVDKKPADWGNGKNDNITGTATICPPATGVNYKAPAVVGATSYNWVLPAGFTITSGAGTNDIMVSVSTSASSTLQTISVTAVNACGSNAAKTFAVTVSDFAAVNVGNDTAVCVGGSINLTASRLDIANTVTWSVSPAGAGTFTFLTTPLTPTFTPSITPTTPTTLTITATPNSIAGACKVTPDNLILTVLPMPTASISGSTTICSGSSANITFTGTPNTTVTYKVNGGANQTIAIGASGTATLNTGALSDTTTYSLLSVSYTSPSLCPVPLSESVRVDVNRLATVNAGLPQTVCQNAGAITLTGASVGGGASKAAWSILSGGGTLSSTALTADPATVTYTPNSGYSGDVVLQLASEDPAGPCNAVLSTKTITINPIPIVSAGANQTICASGTASLAGSFGGSATSVTWTTNGTGTFSNVNNPAAIYTPSAADIASGSVTLTITTNDPDGAGPCLPASSSMSLTINPLPIVDPAGNLQVCQSIPAAPIALSGAIVYGGANSGAWSILSGGGSLSSTDITNNPGAVTYTPANNYTGDVVLQLTSADPTGPCPAISANKTITIFPAPVVSAGANQTICSGSTAIMTASLSGSATSGTWTTTGSGSFSNNSPSAIYTPSAADIIAGTVTLTYSTNDPAGPCTSVSASMILTINQAAVISAGPNQTICSNVTATMAGSFSGSANSGTWTTSGSGTFSNNNPTAVYTPSLADITAGSVTLTYTSNDPDGPCGPATSSMVLTIIRAPQITTQPANRAVCATFSVNLSVVAVGTGITYQWYKGTYPTGVAMTNGGNISGATSATMNFAQAVQSDAGKYYVVISGTSPCVSVVSQQATLVVDQKINITLQPVSKEVCDGGTVTFTVAASTANNDPLSFQWRFNGDDIPGATSPTLTITNATDLDAGEYDVLITGPSGFTCQSVISEKVTLTVNPIPNVIATPSSTTICAQSNLTMSLSGGVPGTTYNWTLVTTGGASIAPLGNSGSTTSNSFIHTPSTPGPGDGTLQYTITPTAAGCTGASTVVNVTVKPLPAGSIVAGVGGTVTVCQNSTAPLITFTGTNGTAPYSFNYRINGGPTDTVTTSGGNSVSVPASTAAVGSFVYSLVGVADATIVGCAQNAAGTATVTVNPQPDATISASTGSVCINFASPTITITGSNGTAPYKFNYTINGVAQPQITSVGNTATITVPTGTAGTFTYALTSVTDATATACSKVLTASTAVVVTPISSITLASPAITANQSVCINNNISPIIYNIGGTGTGASATGLPAGVGFAYNSTTKQFIISGTPAVSGPFEYTITTSGPCGNVSVKGTINVDSNPVGGSTSNSNGNFACEGSNGGTISLTGHQGNVLRWESSTNGGLSWASISNTTAACVYSNITQTTWYRAVVGKSLCAGIIAYSTHTMVSVVPQSPNNGGLVATAAPQFICTGTATLSATGFGSGSNVGSTTGGEFDDAGVNLDGPGLWRKTLIKDVDAQDKINIEASTNNTRNSAFNLTNGPKTFDLALGCTPITYNNNPLGGQVNNTKFMAVVGQNTSSLESPIFNLVGLTSASMDWWESYDLKAGASIKMEISLDGGNTYTQTLKTITGPANYANPLDFQPSTLNLSAFVGLSNLRVRFTYTGTGCSSWGLEMIKITKGIAPATYNWNLINPIPPSGNVVDHFLNVFQNPSVVVTPPQPNMTNAPITYTYSLQASNGGCISNLLVTVNPTPTAAAIAPAPICSGGSITIPISGTVVGTTFTWVRNPNPNVTGTASNCNTNCSVINDVLTNNSTVDQTVTYTVTPYYSNGGVSCPGTPINIPVIVKARPTATITASYVCNGATGGVANVSVTITGSGAITGMLQPGNIALSGTAPATLTFNVPVTGNTNFSLSALSVNGCAAAALPAPVTLTIPGIGPAGLWVGTVDNDWFNRCNWANITVPDNSVDVTIPGTAVRFCEINPNTSPFATLYADVARSKNIMITSQELRFGPTTPKLSLLNVNGNVTIDNTNTSYVNMIAGGEIELNGNWFNNRSTAGFAEGAGTVEFMGTTVQTINAADTKETYNNLIINNNSNLDNGVTLNKAVDVSGVLTLTAGAKGRVLTTLTNLMTVTNPVTSSVVGGEVSIYINGPIARHTNTTGSYNFPVGKPDGPYIVYRPAIVRPVSTSATVYRTEYFGDPGPVLNQRQMVGILNTEYWQIDRTVGTANAVVQLYYINPNNDAHWSDLGPSTCSISCNVAIAKNYDNAANMWYFTNYPAFSGFSTAIPEITYWPNSTLLSSKVISSFSPFTFAYDFNTILSLPVTLLRFDGMLQESDAALNWKLAYGDNVLAIDVEHSIDGYNFTKIGTVTPQGLTDYSFLHKNIPFGANYYRLLLKDKNGNRDYSKAIQINRSGDLYTRIHGLKSNPIQTDAMLSVTSAVSQMINWKLVDQQGKLLMSGKTMVAKGVNTVRLPMPLIPNGFYFLHARTDDGVEAALKLVKE